MTTRGSLSRFYQLLPAGGGEAGVPNPLSYPPSPFRESTVVSVALGGRSLPVVCRGAGGCGAARAHWMLEAQLDAGPGCQRRLALRIRRQWRGCCAPGRLQVPPPITRALPLQVVGMSLSKTSCALRRSRGSVHKALRAPAECEGREGVSDIIMHERARGTLACYRSMCSASRRGAPLQPERPTPRPGRPPAL